MGPRRRTPPPSAILGDAAAGFFKRWRRAALVDSLLSAVELSCAGRHLFQDLGLEKAGLTESKESGLCVAALHGMAKKQWIYSGLWEGFTKVSYVNHFAAICQRLSEIDTVLGLPKVVQHHDKNICIFCHHTDMTTLREFHSLLNKIRISICYALAYVI